MWLYSTYESSWHNGNNDFFFLVKPELIFLLFLAVFILHRCFSSLAVLGSAMSALMYCDPLLVLRLIYVDELPWASWRSGIIATQGMRDHAVWPRQTNLWHTCSVFVFLKLHLWWTPVPWSSCSVSPKIWNAMTWSNCFGLCDVMAVA